MYSDQVWCSGEVGQLSHCCRVVPMQAASGLTLGSGDNVSMLTSQTLSGTERATFSQPEKDPFVKTMQLLRQSRPFTFETGQTRGQG